MKIDVYNYYGQLLGTISVNGGDVHLENADGAASGSAFQCIRMLMSEFGGPASMPYAARLRNLAHSGQTDSELGSIRVRK